MEEQKEMSKPLVATICLVVFITGLAFGNFVKLSSTGELTRSLSSSPTEISVSPKSLIAGETLMISVIPNKNGIDDENGGIWFYTVNEAGLLNVRVDKSWDVCKYGATCYEPVIVQYRIPSNWNLGKYAAVVLDGKTKEKIWSQDSVFMVEYTKPK